MDDYDEDTSNLIYCVIIHMYVVQSKSLQECHILYQTKTPVKECTSEIAAAPVSGTEALEKSSCPNVNNEDETTETISSNEPPNNTLDVQNAEKAENIDCKVPAADEQSSNRDTTPLNLLIETSNENLTILRNQQKLMSPFLSVGSRKNTEVGDGNVDKPKTERVASPLFAASPSLAVSPSINQSSASMSATHPPSSGTTTVTKAYSAPHATTLNLMTPDAFTSSAPTGKGIKLSRLSLLCKCNLFPFTLLHNFRTNDIGEC